MRDFQKGSKRAKSTADRTGKRGGKRHTTTTRRDTNREEGGGSVHTGCCIELVLFFSNRYFWRKNVIVRVKRRSLEEFYKKCHDVVMWAFFSVVLVKLVKVPNGKNRNFSSKNDQKWTKNERKKTLYSTMILDKNEKLCKNPLKFT